MLSIKETQRSIIKRLKDSPVPNIEADDLVTTEKAMVFLCTSYQHTPRNIAEKIICKLRKFNLKNKPNVISYETSPRAVKVSLGLIVCDLLDSDLLPVQVLVIAKWE